MEEFQLATYSPSGLILESVIHTDQLNNRKGYDPDFLSSNIPIPELTLSEQKQDAAKVFTNVGPNGDYVLDYTHFSVVFNKSAKLPFYTAVNNVGKTSLIGRIHDARGSDVWYQDNRIEDADGNYQYGNGDYRCSQFAKGHMVRYYDPAWGTDDEAKIAMGDTFHFTNCCPQIAYFNGVVWNYLEDYSIALSMFQENRVSIFAGPIFNKAETINGLLVPLNFWKIIVFEKDRKLSAQGFIMSQEPYLKNIQQRGLLLEEVIKTVNPTLKPADVERLFDKDELMAAQTKISLIEEKTGLSFGLNDADEFKDKSQYALTLINKPKGIVQTYEEFRGDMDTVKWSHFLKNL